MNRGRKRRTIIVYSVQFEKPERAGKSEQEDLIIKEDESNTEARARLNYMYNRPIIISVPHLRTQKPNWCTMNRCYSVVCGSALAACAVGLNSE